MGDNSGRSDAFFETEYEPVRTAEDIAAEVVRKAIERGVLAPGERINEESIARKLRISRMPVRQALRALQAEGLVRHIPRSGTVVTELTHDDIVEIYNMRAVLEGLAIREAVPRYTEKDLELLRSRLEEMEAKSTTIDDYVDLNDRFHQELYAPSRWTRVIDLTNQLRRNVGRYIRLSISDPDAFKNSRREHWDILAACRGGDAAAAEALVRQHVLHAADVLLRLLPHRAQGNLTRVDPSGSDPTRGDR